MSCGNRPGTNRSAKPEKAPSDRYTRASYLRAIYPGCDKAFPPPPSLCKADGETNAQWRARLTPAHHMGEYVELHAVKLPERSWCTSRVWREMGKNRASFTRNSRPCVTAPMRSSTVLALVVLLCISLSAQPHGDRGDHLRRAGDGGPEGTRAQAITDNASCALTLG
jgi:hypothetical protein